MGKSWGIGFLGALLVGAGILMTLFSLLAAAFGGSGSLALPFGIAIMAGGSYMRYLSNQTVRTLSDNNERSSANVSIAMAASNPHQGSGNPGVDFRIFNSNDINLSNDAFKLFLISYYSIQKNELLQKFVFNEKIYESLDDALNSAMNLYIENINSKK